MQASGSAISNPQGGNTSNGGAAGANNSNENIDELEVAASFDAGPVRLGIGMIQVSGRDATAAVGSAQPEDIIGLSASGSFAGVGLSGSYQSQDVPNTSLTNTSIVISATFSNFYAHLESLDNDEAAGANNPDPTSLTLGYTHNVGPRTTMWFEYQNVDADVPNNSNADLDVIRAALRYDIL